MWHTTARAAVELGIARAGERPSQQEVRRPTLVSLLAGRHPVTGKPFRRAGGDGTEATAAANTDPQLRMETEARITGSWVHVLRTLVGEQPAVPLPGPIR